MKRVLVTGAGGFIGGHLVTRLLREGFHVNCLVRRPPKTPVAWTMRGFSAPSLTSAACFTIGDVRDPASLEEPLRNVDVVLHLAGLLKAFNRAELDETNVAGVVNVIEAAARRATPPLVVIVSSLSAAGPSLSGRAHREPDPCKPVSLYGASKLAGELAAQSLAERVPMTIVRPPVVFGEGDRETLRLFSMAKTGVFPTIGLRPARLSLIHVSDLVTGLIEVACRGERLLPAFEEPDIGHGRYYMATEEAPDQASLGQLLGSAVGAARVVTIPAPRSIAWLAGATSELVSRCRGRPSLFCLDKVREGAAGDWVCSPDKALEDLGCGAKASLRTRLEQTANWYLENGWL